MTTSVVLAWLLAAGILATAAWRSRRELQRWLGTDPLGRRRALRAALLALTIGGVGQALLLSAAEPPRLGGSGADVVIALDVSRSMDARDVPPTRLRRAVRVAERLVQAADGVRLALVLFAADAFVALPLTQDRDVLLAYLAAVDTEMISHAGTDLTRALDTAARSFDPRSSRPRRILLLSDGEDAGGDLAGALGRARSAGIDVFPVGFGTPAGALVPGAGGQPLLDARGDEVLSRRDDTVLRGIAVSTGGRYHRELEDRPAAARLLPDPAAAPDRPSPPALSIPRLLVVLAALLLVAEGTLSVRPGTGVRRPTHAAGGNRQVPSAGGALGRATALALLAGVLVAPATSDMLRQGDARFEAGEFGEALRLYRRGERRAGVTPATRLRIGNAHYRLGELEEAAAAYLATLRRLTGEQQEEQFVAAYNLGTALLARERFVEARDALWTALLTDPTRPEARFNYEWALERIPEPEEIPVPPSPQPREEPEPRPEERTRPTPAEPEPERRVLGSQIGEQEMQRWLDSVEDRPTEPLRRQIASSLDARERGRSARQTW